MSGTAKTDIEPIEPEDAEGAAYLAALTVLFEEWSSAADAEAYDYL